ncbi:MAG: MFS transporter [Candidatus Binatia bacterium]|nr:MFS transporter [Candidatus Binatia bacterium]
MSDARPSILPTSTIFAYCLPSTGLGLVMMLFSIYLMKFSTDVLLIAPAAMGTLLGLGRFWDAVSDPVAGYLSDRTMSRSGRRRTWMLASAVPLAATFVMVWAPPEALTGFALILWMGAALFAFETASTAFAIPYGALGLELTTAYHERTRLFAYRHVLQAIGALLGLGGVYLLRTAAVPRTMAFWVSLFAGVAMATAIGIAVTRLREPLAHQGRGSVRITKAFADVFRNEPGRLLFVVYGIETFGMTSVTMLSPYIMQYIVLAPDLTEALILVYFLPQVGLTPLWVRLARRFGKKKLWLMAMVFQAAGFFAMFWVGEDGYVLLFVILFLIGVGGGCSLVVAPAIQADVVDYDEFLTHERKEGAYFAIWNMIRKGAFGVGAILTGTLLQWVGFQPNVEQTETTRTAMLALVGILPGACYLAGALLFTRFGLNEPEHAAIAAELEARSPPGAG